MTAFRRLDEHTMVAGQITAAQVAEAASAEVRTIINNRPDDEEPGQPSSVDIEAAATTAGLAYRYIPVAGGFSLAQVEAMAEALEHGPALAFCRSGTRSTYLWALAKARQGEDAETIVRAAGEAGYDLSPILPYLLPR